MKSHEFISETTTAGGIATVVSPIGDTVKRSIYGTKSKKKKKVKEDDKYMNTIKRG